MALRLACLACAVLAATASPTSSTLGGNITIVSYEPNTCRGVASISDRFNLTSGHIYAIGSDRVATRVGVPDPGQDLSCTCGLDTDVSYGSCMKFNGDYLKFPSVLPYERCAVSRNCRDSDSTVIGETSNGGVSEVFSMRRCSVGSRREIARYDAVSYLVPHSTIDGAGGYRFVIPVAWRCPPSGSLFASTAVRFELRFAQAGYLPMPAALSAVSGSVWGVDAGPSSPSSDAPGTNYPYSGFPSTLSAGVAPDCPPGKWTHMNYSVMVAVPEGELPEHDTYLMFRLRTRFQGSFPVVRPPGCPECISGVCQDRPGILGSRGSALVRFAGSGSRVGGAEVLARRTSDAIAARHNSTEHMVSQRVRMDMFVLDQRIVGTTAFVDLAVMSWDMMVNRHNDHAVVLYAVADHLPGVEGVTERSMAELDEVVRNPFDPLRMGTASRCMAYGPSAAPLPQSVTGASTAGAALRAAFSNYGTAGAPAPTSTSGSWQQGNACARLNAARYRMSTRGSGEAVGVRCGGTGTAKYHMVQLQFAVSGSASVMGSGCSASIVCHPGPSDDPLGCGNAATAASEGRTVPYRFTIYATAFAHATHPLKGDRVYSHTVHQSMSLFLRGSSRLLVRRENEASFVFFSFSTLRDAEGVLIVDSGSAMQVVQEDSPIPALSAGGVGRLALAVNATPSLVDPDSTHHIQMQESRMCTLREEHTRSYHSLAHLWEVVYQPGESTSRVPACHEDGFRALVEDGDTWALRACEYAGMDPDGGCALFADVLPVATVEGPDVNITECIYDNAVSSQSDLYQRRCTLPRAGLSSIGISAPVRGDNSHVVGIVRRSGFSRYSLFRATAIAFVASASYPQTVVEASAPYVTQVPPYPEIKVDESLPPGGAGGGTGGGTIGVEDLKKLVDDFKGLDQVVQFAAIGGAAALVLGIIALVVYRSKAMSRGSRPVGEGSGSGHNGGGGGGKRSRKKGGGRKAHRRGHDSV